MFIFFNDAVMEETSACISVTDRGFLYGDGLFETFRTYGKEPFRLESHVDRLASSARYFDIPFRYPAGQIRLIIGQLLEKNTLKDAYVRMTLSRGPWAGGLIPGGACSPTLVIQAKPLAGYPPGLCVDGVPLITSPFRRSVSCPVSAHKTLNFLPNYLIKKEAVDKGAHDALILNTDNHVAECSVSNVFLVEGGSVTTPSLKANILPGVTRRVVMDLCAESNIQITEGLFGLERVFRADEVFLTNSLMEIMPVSTIDGRRIGHLVPGRVTKFLYSKYKALVFGQDAEEF